MKQIPISSWRQVPADARLRHLFLGKLKRNVDSPQKALAEFCYCAAAHAAQRFRNVMRSGKFKGWLGYSGINLDMPVRCAEGVYVSANRSMATNLLRISLLAEAIGEASGCYLAYEAEDAADTEVSVQVHKKAFHRIEPAEIATVKPVALVLGTRRISVRSWNDCLPEYIRYVKTSVPFGETMAPVIPRDYERLTPAECLEEMRSIIERSGLDRYSVCLEYDLTANAQTSVIERGKSVAGKLSGGQIRDVTVAGSRVVHSRHFRQFAPAVSVW